MKKLYKFLTVVTALLPGLCSNASAQSTTLFSYSGSIQSWTVPAGVTSINVDARGAIGGAGSASISRGGYGGCVRAELAVTPGQVLYVFVGQRGADGLTTSGGVGGANPVPSGGDGGLGYSPYAGGGGGAASDLRMGGTALSNRVIVAGGGGGAGYNYSSTDFDRGGDGGGTTGESGYEGGSSGGSPTGGGGTPTAGGSAGFYSGWGSATAGTFGIGGISGSPAGGGGGGGGWYGGGGGSWGGGGGGSNYTHPTLATLVTHTRGCNTGGDGALTIRVVCTPPVGGAILGPSGLCVGATATLSNPTGSSGGTWSSSVTGVATINPTTGVVTAVAPGATIITYSLSLSCGSAMAVTFLTVNPLPLTITGSTNLCTGTTTTLFNASAGGSWSSTDPLVATVDPVTGIVSGMAVGVASIVYTMPSGCSTSIVVVVAGISGPNSVCTGNSIALTSTATGGTWSSSRSDLATVGATTGTVRGLSMGTATITYTLGIGCTATKLVTVNPLAPIVGQDSVCSGGRTYLTNIIGGGTWSSTNPAVAMIALDSGLVDGLMPGVAVISYLLPTGCLAKDTVRVIALPPASTGVMRACPGTTTNLFNTVPGGRWTTANAGVATIGATSGVVTGVTPDTTSVFYTITPGCQVRSVVTINPLPALIRGIDVGCPGTKDTFTNESEGGLWSSATTTIATVVDTTGAVSLVSGGTAVIRYTLPTGCTRSKTFTVYPGPLPVITYDWRTATFYTPNIYVSYQWYDSAQGLIPGATSPSLASLYTQYYFVEVTDTNGCVGRSAITRFNAATLGLGNAGGANARIYPNPASDVLYITADVAVRAVITSIDGKKLMDKERATELNISNLASGIYLIGLYDDNGQIVSLEKFTKL